MKRVFLVPNGIAVTRIAILLNPKLKGTTSIFASDETCPGMEKDPAQTGEEMIDKMGLRV